MEKHKTTALMGGQGLGHSQNAKETPAGQITPDGSSHDPACGQSLRLCPFHNKFLIAHQSFGMFVAKDR